MGFGPEYQGSQPNIEAALQKFSPDKVSSVQVRHDMSVAKSVSNERAEGNQVFLSL
jgi:hypothetical protein